MATTSTATATASAASDLKRRMPTTAGTSTDPRGWRWFRSLPVWVQVAVWAVIAPLPAGLWAASEPRGRRVPALGFVALVAIAWVVGAAQLGPDEVAGEAGDHVAPAAEGGSTVPSASGVTGAPNDPGKSRTTTTTPTLPESTIGAPQVGAYSAAAALVDRLTVAAPAGDSSYDRDLFGGGWIDADQDGCDTRAEVLMAESRSSAQVDPYGCSVVSGDWVSTYDGAVFTDPADLEIDHVVALAEAWRSGAWAWLPERRLAFANELDHPDTLVAVSATSNGSKSDRDPASWLPSATSDQCRFASAWTTVKVRWDLTADENEVAALRSVLSRC